MLSASANSPATVVLDLSGVTFMDSSGLSVIIAAWRRSVQQGHGFTLTGLTPAVARLFKTTSLDSLIPIRVTDQE